MPQDQPEREADTSKGTLSQHGVTTLLRQWSGGSEEASDRLIELVYAELRKLAARHLRKERRDHTLQPTELVNEVYLRLQAQRRVDLGNRAQFYGFAGTLMRRILVDHARSRLTQKRGQGVAMLSLDHAPESAIVADLDLDKLLSLDGALKKLEEKQPRQVKVIDLHFFAGRSFRETGEILNISTAKAKREWAAAKAWFASEMTPENPTDRVRR